VLLPGQVHISRRTRRRFNSGAFRLEADSAFAEVINACAAPRAGQPGTWITQDMREGYCALHRAGYAHSVEVWRGNLLAGGIYGIALGRMFYGESMFSREPDASKIALIALCRFLQSANFGLLDCQVPNPHLASMGAVEISRQEFEARLRELVAEPEIPGPWMGMLDVNHRW
jgi:leucyl/phenylalanyl-tRNA--protein transferase